MAEQSSANPFETVYPPRCEGICHLGPKALELVNGVLGRNCPGAQLFSDETLVVQIDPQQSLDVLPTTPDDRERLACANPRLVRAVRKTIDSKINELIVETVEMDV